VKGQKTKEESVQDQKDEKKKGLFRKGNIREGTPGRGVVKLCKGPGERMRGKGKPRRRRTGDG